MKKIENMCLDAERALYGERSVLVERCRFEGPADGESALKECKDIVAKNCFFALRYPFWHDVGASLSDSEMTVACRAPFWYSRNVSVDRSILHGDKAFRECKNVTLRACDVRSLEFGWSVDGFEIENTSAEGEYFLLRSARVRIKNLTFSGKYSFQYVKDAVIENSVLDTKDAFWHAENVTVRDSVLKGEYLGWYSKKLTLVRCKIIGTQPLCYSEGLRLIDCEMENTDLAFERSTVRASIKTPVLSIKNPKRGRISAPAVGEIICDEEWAKGTVIIT